MSAFRAACRAAALRLLSEYGQEADLKLSIYAGRPASIAPPHAFIDTLQEADDYDAQQTRTISLGIVVIHGLFDSAVAVGQADDFADGFIEFCWRRENFHAIDESSELRMTATADDASYTPEWIAEERQLTYYATRYTLEGTRWGG